VVCNLPGDDVCATCRARLNVIAEPVCERCGAPTAWPVRRCAECAGRRLAFASARAAVVYDANVRALVAGWKERGLRRLCVLAADVVEGRVGRPGVDALAFVPADPERRLERGHHPAETLARELAARWDLPVAAVLGRTRAARRQTGLPLAERRRNVARAFAATASVPRRVGLVDDVYTTGATAGAAASALRGGGARRVEVVTFARAVRSR
jgi:predicted amidophosphoribosyltransferase